jgi:hypothetical protein
MPQVALNGPPVVSAQDEPDGFVKRPGSISVWYIPQAPGASWLSSGWPPGEKPYPACKTSGGGDFWKTLFSKASAWAWREQGRELFISEMSCQAVFSWRVPETSWESLENAFAQEGNRPVAVWDRPIRGVIPGGSHSDFSILYPWTLSLGRHFSLPTASRQKQQSRSRAEFSHLSA